MVQKLPIVTLCGSCKTVIPVRDAEHCWFCGDDLCIGCWDRTGHCGHAAANAINEASKQGPVLQDQMDRIMADHLSPTCEIHGADHGGAIKRLTA